MREQHSTPIGGVYMQPHAFAVCDASQCTDIVDGPGVRGSENTDNAHGANPVFLVLCDRFLKCIEPHLKIRIRRQSAQRVTSEPDAIDSFVDGNVPLLRGIYGLAIADAVVLCDVARHRIAPNL
jgi:hypothetical protein